MMSIEVRLPDLGTGTQEAKLIAWLKREGDTVQAGEPLAEVETDKTTVEIAAPGSGVLAKIVVAAGADAVPQDALLALIGDSPLVVAGSRATTPDATASTGSPASMIPTAVGEPIPSTTPSAVVTPTPATHDGHDGNEPPASLFVRRMAVAAGIPLSSLRGSGRDGRLTREDVERALDVRQPQTRRLERVEHHAEKGAGSGNARPSALRRVTGERLTHAKQTIPHFYLRTECHMDAVARTRADHNARAARHLSVTPFVVRAAALALRDVPAANAWWVDGGLHHCASVDIAVAVMTPAGLIAPVLRRADQHSVLQLATELERLADRARAGRLTPDEYANGTFTISNLGMYGVTSLYPIINPPQTCILGVGLLEERAIARDGAVTAGWMMTCTLSADHRALDGATGAEFLAAFRRRIEDPWQLML